MSRALGSSNIEKVLAENRTRNLRGEMGVIEFNYNIINVGRLFKHSSNKTL